MGLNINCGPYFKVPPESLKKGNVHEGVRHDPIFICMRPQMGQNQALLALIGEGNVSFFNPKIA